MSSFLNKHTEKPEDGNWFFRYINRSFHSDIDLVCEEFEVYSKTPKGCWIVPSWAIFDREDAEKTKKFVRNIGRKKYAYPTRDEAMKSFICRKKKQIEILNRQLKNAEDAYKLAGGVWPIPQRRVALYFDY